MKNLFNIEKNVGIFGMHIVNYPARPESEGKYNIFSENEVDKMEDWHPILLKDTIITDINYFLDHIDEIKEYAEKFKRRE